MSIGWWAVLYHACLAAPVLGGSGPRSIDGIIARRAISVTDVQPLAPDLVLGILFIVAFAKTRESARAGS